jgi:hypothetical protein
VGGDWGNRSYKAFGVSVADRPKAKIFFKSKETQKLEPYYLYSTEKTQEINYKMYLVETTSLRRQELSQHSMSS